jgi:hypothetical protein
MGPFKHRGGGGGGKNNGDGCNTFGINIYSQENCLYNRKYVLKMLNIAFELNFFSQLFVRSNVKHLFDVPFGKSSQHPSSILTRCFILVIKCDQTLSYKYNLSRLLFVV